MPNGHFNERIGENFLQKGTQISCLSRACRMIKDRLVLEVFWDGRVIIKYIIYGNFTVSNGIGSEGPCTYFSYNALSTNNMVLTTHNIMCT